ncbi:MAG: hypothetical protein U1F27_03380 [Turneriella sp.]
MKSCRGIILFLLVACSAGVYADDWSEIAAQNPQFAAAEKNFVSEEAQKMRAAGLDAKPLYNKIREGLAKGVSGDVLKRAVTRERESYERAAKQTGAMRNITPALRMSLCQAIVISVRRGTREQDIEAALQRSGNSAEKLTRIVDLLGDLARSGIHGESAVNAAVENTGRMPGGGASDRNESRADANRSLQHRELKQNLPQLKPPPAPPHRELFPQK